MAFIVRPSMSLDEAAAAQRIDDALWDRGYQHYEWLYEAAKRERDQALLLVAVDEQEVIGYVGVERFAAKHIGTGMPPWEHEPEEWHDPKGRIYHLTGAGVLEAYRGQGVFGALIGELLGRATANESITSVATTYNLRHPTVTDPEKVWGRFGFAALEWTRDERWNHDGIYHPKDAPPDGAIVYLKETAKAPPHPRCR